MGTSSFLAANSKSLAAPVVGLGLALSSQEDAQQWLLSCHFPATVQDPPPELFLELFYP